MELIVQLLRLEYFAFQYLYPPLQLATLLFGPRWTRLASLACLVPAGLLYVVGVLRPSQGQGDLSGIFVILLAPFPLLALSILLGVAVYSVRRQRAG